MAPSLLLQVVAVGAALVLLVAAARRVFDEEPGGAWLLAVGLVPIVGPLLLALALWREGRRLRAWRAGRGSFGGRAARARLDELLRHRAGGIRLPAETREAAQIAFRLGRDADAATLAAEYLERFDDDLAAHYLLARALAALGRHAEAVAAFQEVARRDLTHDAGGALLGLARGFLALGDATRARLALDEAIARCREPEALFLAGRLAAEAGERDEALRLWRACERMARDSSGPRRRLDREWGRRARVAREGLAP